MITAGELAAGAAHLGELCAEQGRREVPILAAGGSVLLSPGTSAHDLDAHVAALTEGYRIPAETASQLPLSGPPAAVAERLEEYASAGAQHIVLGLIGSNWREQCDQLAEAITLL
jgi:alkanesulfonate monooxygenase SsuD/methylene tetrahydromethanopterin reductase-like flavin-dependent oxidoreductase (luciferase family)